MNLRFVALVVAVGTRDWTLVSWPVVPAVIRALGHDSKRRDGDLQIGIPLLNLVPYLALPMTG
jgi:hypothetical protein